MSTSAFTSFFLVAYTTITGVQQIDRTVLEAATHFGARGRALFAKVLLPGTMPFIFTGMRLGLGYALIVVIAVEMVSRSPGCCRAANKSTDAGSWPGSEPIAFSG